MLISYFADCLNVDLSDFFFMINLRSVKLLEFVWWPELGNIIMNTYIFNLFIHISICIHFRTTSSYWYLQLFPLLHGLFSLLSLLICIYFHSKSGSHYPSSVYLLDLFQYPWYIALSNPRLSRFLSYVVFLEMSFVFYI